MSTIRRFEKLIEDIIEKPFARLFNTRLHPADIAKAMANAMEQGLISDGREGHIAPNFYQINLNVEDYRVLSNESDLEAEKESIKHYLENLVSELDVSKPGVLEVIIQVSPDVRMGQISIDADHLEVVRSDQAHQKAEVDTKPLKTNSP